MAKSQAIITRETFRFFRDLSRNNRTGWMQARRGRYHRLSHLFRIEAQGFRAGAGRRPAHASESAVAGAAEETLESPIRKLLVFRGKRRLDQAYRLAGRSGL